MQRKKLWELEPRFHCPVIGTCFTLEELRRIARKAGIHIGVALTDYELHHSFVHVAGQSVYATRVMHQWLDRKFEASIRHLRSRRDALELSAFWEQAVADGNIAGAFWALLTLADLPDALAQRLFGEVHMLSHLAGHTQRMAQREVVAMRRQVAGVEERLAWTAEATRLRIQELERRAERHEALMRETEVLRGELEAAQARLAALENGETVSRLRAENTALTAQLRQALERAHRAKREARDWAALAAETATPPEAPQTGKIPPVASQPCPASCDAGEAGDCPGPDLCGQRILYVGGRNRQVAHFRSLVERHNGEFLHHDGGLSESAARLTAMIRSADAVVCPVDCVSHDARLRVKRVCKRTAKRFVALRSASLSSFSESLQAIVV